MRHTFNEIMMTKNQYGEYSPLRTLIGGGLLVKPFNKLLREQDALGLNSDVNRILSNMMCMLSDEMVEKVRRCLYAHNALKSGQRIKMSQ